MTSHAFKITSALTVLVPLVRRSTHVPEEMRRALDHPLVDVVMAVGTVYTSTDKSSVITILALATLVAMAVYLPSAPPLPSPSLLGQDFPFPKTNDREDETKES